jgi:hypothetical protein
MRRFEKVYRRMRKLLSKKRTELSAFRKNGNKELKKMG